MVERVNQDHFIDNFIFFDSYPVEKLKDINEFLEGNVIPYFTPYDVHKILILKSCNQILFPEFCFVNRAYNDIPEWKEICNIVNPLVEFMTESVNSKFENHYPCHAEINIILPGSSMALHADDHFGVGEDYRTHLVLSTNDLVRFIVENKSTTLHQGTCFIFDNTKKHAVYNNHTSLSRAHLVIDYSTKFTSRKNARR